MSRAAAAQASLVERKGRGNEASLKRGLPSAFPLMLVFGFVLNVYGLPYYLLPIAQRVRHPLHDLLKPSGVIGQSAGIVTFLLFAFLWLYPLRKRVSWLKVTGSLGRWLDYHIAAGLLIPLFGAIHAAWRFGGLIGLGYTAMFVVCVSGFIGKYIYARVPHARSGAELSLEEMTTERRHLLDELSSSTGFEIATLEAMLAPTPTEEASPSMLGSLVAMVRDDLSRRRAVRRLVRQWRRVATEGQTVDRKALRRTVALARREMALNQQMRMLDATQRVFRFWHAAHLPVAISAFLAVLIHIAVVVVIGSTWFW